MRSLCFVSKVHSAEHIVVEATNGTCGTNNFLENSDNPCLLISVGAKRVLTSWLLRKRQKFMGNASVDGLENNNGSHKYSPEHSSSISFKWLSSDMPVKCVRTQKKTQNSENLVGPLEEVPDSNSVSSSNDKELKPLCYALDNDWRYLAVTAFLVNVAKSRQVNLLASTFIPKMRQIEEYVTLFYLLSGLQSVLLLLHALMLL